MRKEIIKENNPLLNTDDSLTIKTAMQEINHKEILDDAGVSGIKVAKFKFCVKDRSQINLIPKYLDNLYDSVKQNTRETYTYKNLIDSSMIGFKKDMLGMMVGQHKDLIYSYNILADYAKGESSYKINRKNSKKILEKISKLSDEEYAKNEDKIARMIDKKSEYRYVSPKLNSLIVEIFVYWR